MGRRKKIKKSKCRRLDCSNELVPGMTVCFDHASKEELHATYLDCYVKFDGYQKKAHEVTHDAWLLKNQLIQKACSSERKGKGCSKKEPTKEKDCVVCWNKYFKRRFGKGIREMATIDW